MSSKSLVFEKASRGALVLTLALTLCAAAFGAEPENGRSVPAVAKTVRTATAGGATLISVQGSRPLSYSVRRADERLIVLELPGVDASPLASSYRVHTPLVEAVRVERAHKSEGPRASLLIGLRAPVSERSHLEGNELVLELRPAAKGLQSPNTQPELKARASYASPVAETEGSGGQTAQQQPSQGQQYGQPGFVGEPISLNVVNADVRDILNYITEQYGVNFVVDASVGRVPVTINVTDVPWNFAMNSILKANRLGVEVNGNILRIATIEVLKKESEMRADEASARSRLREAELYNLPLVTEIIRLNYARALGTLGQASEGTAIFTGGVGNDLQYQQEAGAAGGTGAGTGGGGQITSNPSNVGILPIIQRRLSRRGSVEVDGRSNTLIVTDVQENISAIRRLVELLDQPEPQVEIETRIVLANRTFSRDLGVQLSAVAINAGRGALGSFSTARAAGDITTGPNPFGLPGGLANTTQPTGTLGATAASTVIGLTTGVIGSAQISALITAAEQKGQAKIIATPRVTALNNRPAQIEAGSQIPVVTPQTGGGGGGGGSVFTTTFVSVPLRLSITPQITDAGTVVLRVVMENNSVNLALTNALGTPGIDTQRMQTEVLVPDGGTTVVGGVLNDRESENQNRTPGLSSIPVVGNLFKRKAVTRNTDEILFFITPRIYRPDYQGRRIEAAPSTGTRSVTIPQPVPLGNPESNTPVPTSPALPREGRPEVVVPIDVAPASGVRP